jgi:hypothetical protein
MGNEDEDEAVPGDEAPAAQPGTYDQTFFLDRAAKGKDEWNKRRHNPANKDVRVTFVGTFQRGPPHSNFRMVSLP